MPIFSLYIRGFGSSYIIMLRYRNYCTFLFRVFVNINNIQNISDQGISFETNCVGRGWVFWVCIWGGEGKRRVEKKKKKGKSQSNHRNWKPLFLACLQRLNRAAHWEEKVPLKYHLKLLTTLTKAQHFFFFLKNNSVLEIYTPSTKVSIMQTINGHRPFSKTNLAPCF